jgi:alkylation response protein AidB-like acyl-CoA dehydrogenase
MNRTSTAQLEIERDVIESASEWAARLPEYAEVFEQQNRLTPDIAKQFAEAGFFHMNVPQEYGGLEVHPRTMVEVIKTVARGDASAAWNVMIGATTGLLAAGLPDKFASEIYGDKPGVLSVGTTAPLGKASVVEGGYEVTGRWPFGSGCQNADWISGGCFIFENGQQRKNHKGAPEIQLMMFDAASVEIEDTWRVSGLKGTGSHHFNVDQAFVPEGRSVLLGGRSRIQRPLYQFPMLGLLALGVSSVSLGIAYHALDAFIALAGSKTPTGSLRRTAEREMVQGDVGRCFADLRSAEAYIHQAIDEAWEVALQGKRLSNEIKANLRLAAVNATHRSVATVDRLFQAGGGSSIYLDSPLQQCSRDIHVTTQHIMVGNPIYEVVGRVELGLPPGSLL